MTGEDKRRALEEVRDARADLIDAKARYARAMDRAHEVGLPNTIIARELRLSETAVRLYLKRHEGVK